MNERNIIVKFKDKVLAVEDFGKNKEFFFEDFMVKDDLLHILYEMDCFEISLTDEGLDFLKQYYTLDKVADYVIEAIREGVDFKFSNKKDIISWLESKGQFSPIEGTIESIKN